MTTKARARDAALMTTFACYSAGICYAVHAPWYAYLLGVPGLVFVGIALGGALEEALGRR